MRLLIAGLVVLLVGCATGIQPGKEYPSESFIVPVGYQEAYRRVDNHARECMPNAAIAGSLFSDNRTGIVRIASGGIASGEQMNTRIEQIGEQESKLTVTVWGIGHFDQRQIASVRKSVETGKPSCR